MRRIPWQIWLLMLCPYAVLAMNVYLVRVGLVAWLCGCLGTLLIISGLNLVCALRQQDAAKSAWLGMLVKLVHIPFYVLALLAAAVLIAAPPLLLVLPVLNICMLLTTSAYSLRGSYLAWCGGKLSTRAWVLIGVSLLIFVLDVPGSILLHGKLRR